MFEHRNKNKEKKIADFRLQILDCRFLNEWKLQPKTATEN